MENLNNLLLKEGSKYKYKPNHVLVERELVRYKLVAKYFKSGNLLDVGCRSGKFREFLPKNIEYYGLDFVDEHKKYIDNFFSIDVSQTRVPVKDNFFDNIHLGEVLEHISNFLFVFEEMYRILKPGGILVLTVPNNFHIAQAIGILRYKRYKKKNLDIKNVINSDTHIHSFYEPDLLKISQMTGFKPIDCDRFYNFFGKFKLPESIIFKPFAKFLVYVISK